MKVRQTLFGIIFALGLFFTASYSIDNHGFHSGLYGIVGCVMILTSYIGFNWPKVRSGDRHVRHLLWGLIALLVLIIVLDIAEATLS